MHKQQNSDCFSNEFLLEFLNNFPHMKYSDTQRFQNLRHNIRHYFASIGYSCKTSRIFCRNRHFVNFAITIIFICKKRTNSRNVRTDVPAVLNRRYSDVILSNTAERRLPPAGRQTAQTVRDFPVPRTERGVPRGQTKKADPRPRRCSIPPGGGGNSRRTGA